MEKQLKRINKDTKGIEFYDDSQKNVDAVEELGKEFSNIKVRTLLIHY